METYHAGSRAVQDRVGVRELADHVGQIIGQGIKPVAAAFLELQPLLILGAADPDTGRVWASPLTGTPGFVRATGPHQISITGGTAPPTPSPRPSPTPGPPGRHDRPRPPHPPPYASRRPLRRTERGLAIEAERVFSNCPKYIQKRRESYETVADRTPHEPRRGTELTGSQAEFIAAADTFFLATVHEHGADASHRGGNPGFVHATSPHELSWPDYPGNAMFLSLGNLARRPARRTPLPRLDDGHGAPTHRRGKAGVRPRRHPQGPLHRREAVEDTPAASSLLRWSPPEYSPANPSRP
jgi:predicted pyridoxine 5'-phosphate oxidase superfamily flavin-nucleotide-binding protein